VALKIPNISSDHYWQSTADGCTRSRLSRNEIQLVPVTCDVITLSDNANELPSPVSPSSIDNNLVVLSHLHHLAIP
jgi:hypothetical protein